MCQMCEEYEFELVRMGLLEDAKKFREERQREHKKAVVEAHSGDNRVQESSMVSRRL